MQCFIKITLPLLLFGTSAIAQRLPPLAQESSPDYVPDAATARRIAEAVWLPIYGKHIYRNRPFTAVLVADSVWQVEGTLPKGYTKGGVPYAEIRKRDGRVMDVSHGK